MYTQKRSIMTTIAMIVVMSYLCCLGRVMAELLGRCPEGWVYDYPSQECRRLLTWRSSPSSSSSSSSSPANFDEARYFCQAMGGDLLYIEHIETKDWLELELGLTGLEGTSAETWVGARLVNGSWIWLETGNEVNHQLLPWEGGGAGECVAFTDSAILAKRPCALRLNFVCHRPLGMPLACDVAAGWRHIGHYCYWTSQYPDTWPGGERSCLAQNSRLVTVVGQEQQQLALDVASTLRGNVWIGLSERKTPGEWRWTDGTDLNYTVWADNQPVSMDGLGAAAVSATSPQGEWVTGLMLDTHHYLCQKPAEGCVAGWEEFTDSCYYYNTGAGDLAVWDNALGTCQAVGASLVVLETRAEDGYFKDRIPEADSVWLGLYKTEYGDDFYWTNDGNLTNHGFSHMTPGDAEAVLASNDSACVFYQLTVWSTGVKTRSSWVPTDCREARHFVCEVPTGQTLSPTPAQEYVYCSISWLYSEGNCYLFMAQQMSWTVARATCEGLGADLASILTWTEQDFVHNHQMSSGWIGLEWVTENGIGWAWSDHSGTLNLTNWADGEDKPNEEEATCAEIRSADGRWVSVPCTLPRAFTCRRPALDYPVAPLVPTTKSPGSEGCGGEGWTEEPDSGNCYLLVLRDLPFQDALLYCQALEQQQQQQQQGRGEHPPPNLASVTSHKEQAFLTGLVGGTGMSRASLWVGLRSESGVGGAGWVDGAPLSYLNWAPGRPSANHARACVEMYTGSGKWNDITCDLPRSFICKKEGNNYQHPIRPTISPEASCSAGWQAWNHNCYFFSQDVAPWTSARAWCRSHLDSDLTSVTSAEENTFILGEAHLAKQDLWLGLLAAQLTERWAWVDGSPLTFTNWQSGQHYVEDGLCAQYKADGTWHEGQWTPAPCEQEKVYICKTTASVCREGWVHYQGKCYYAGALQDTWRGALEACRAISDKSDLASIHSEDQSAFLADALGTSVGGSMWVGLGYDLLEGVWHWSDGEEVDYSWWAAGEPSHHPAWSFCTQLLSYPVVGVQGHWAALPCDTARPYICQLPASHSVGCETGWLGLGSYCYWYSEDPATAPLPSTAMALTFEQAATACLAQGAQLASVSSELENQLAVSFLHPYGSGEAYLGLTDIGSPGQLAWLDGSSLTFTAWDAFGVNLLSLSPACVVVRGESGRWGAVPCSAPRPYLCKKPTQAIPLDASITSGCDEGDVAHEGSCYHLPDLHQTWQGAATFCSSNGGYLASLDDRPENGFLSSLLGGNSLVGGWIGLTGSSQSDGSVSFTWTHSDPVLFTNWGIGQPDVMEGGCVAMAGVAAAKAVTGERGGRAKNLGEWLVTDCDQKLSFICEYPRQKDNVTIPPQEHTTGPIWLCPNNWFAYAQHCYKVFSDVVNWSHGEIECRTYGGHLTSVSGPEEEEHLLEFIEKSLFNHTYQLVWVGLEEGQSTGHSWSDGSPFSYMNWWPGQPEDQEARYRCGAGLQSSLQLVDAPCHAHLPYICKVHQGGVQATSPPPSQTPDVSCGGSWLVYADHCYLLLSAGRHHLPTTWHAAQCRCQSEGGELASIHSQQDSDWLTSKIFGLSDEVLWVGGLGVQGSGFHWTDHSTFDFNFWDRGEPDNFLAQENCVGIYSHRGGRWADQSCDTLAGSVCKRPQSSATMTTTSLPISPAGIGHCPEGWFPAGASCVRVSTERKTFEKAKLSCSSLSTLLSVHTAMDQGFFTAALSLVEEDVWLGLTVAGDGSFVWLDGSPFTYANWARGEPDGAATGEQCVKVSHSTGLWSDVFCEAELNYICELDQDPYAPTQPTYLACPPPYDAYVSFGGACYRVIHTLKTWQDAEKGCVEEGGGHLASAEGPGEGALLWTLSRDANLTHTWIGLNNRQLSSQFRWSDDRATTYSHWGPRQPDVSLLDNSCVSLDPMNGLWYSRECNDLRPSLCRVTNGSTGAAIPPPPLTGYCQAPHWVDLNNGYCYMVSDDSLSWGRASTACIKEGGNLASIHSQEEMVWVVAMIHELIHPLWLGLARMQDGYGWSDGTALDYLNWVLGELDWGDSEEEGEEEEGCVEVNIDTGGWSNTHCLDLRRYICKTLKTQVIQATNPVVVGGPYTPIPPPTPSTTGGSLTAGGIMGIVLAGTFVMACVAFVINSYRKRRLQSKPVIETANCNFEDLTGSVDSEPDFSIQPIESEADLVQMTNTISSSSHGSYDSTTATA